MSDATPELVLILQRAEHAVEVRRWEMSFCTAPGGPIDPAEAEAALRDAEQRVDDARAALERTA